MASNFKFLETEFPVLANFGNLAEQYCYTDPNSCLMKLGMIGETIVNLMFTYDKIPIPYDNSAVNRINVLSSEGLLTRDLTDILHALRKVRNKAVHENYSESSDCFVFLQMAYSLSEWFMQTYGDWNYRHQNFVMPVKEEDKTETLVVNKAQEEEKEEAKKVFREIFREVAELHPSPYFHIGADETYLLGSCAQCSKVEKSRLFVDYIKAMYEVVKELGKQPIIWADIILMHPEAVQELPKDLIYVDWNYGWEPDRFGKLDNLLKLGAKMWGATALRSAPDNVYLTQWMKHFDNLSTFLPFARSHGYEGIIETSWSTSGTYGFHYDNGWEAVSYTHLTLPTKLEV